MVGLVHAYYRVIQTDTNGLTDVLPNRQCRYPKIDPKQHNYCRAFVSPLHSLIRIHLFLFSRELRSRTTRTAA